MQTFMPLYLKMNTENFLDQETDLVAAMLVIAFMALQLITMKLQQTYSPRWFIPKRFRRNLNAHEYYQVVPASVLRRAQTNKDPAAPSSNEDDITCVICMSYVHYDVDENGGLIRKDGFQDGADALAAMHHQPRFNLSSILQRVRTATQQSWRRLNRRD